MREGDMMMMMMGGRLHERAYYRSMEQSYRSSVVLYDALRAAPIPGFRLLDIPQGHCFQGTFPADCVARRLSIAYPQDAYGMIETALFAEDGKELDYNRALGYSESLPRFDTEAEVRAEI